jgi:plastocyanin
MVRSVAFAVLLLVGGGVFLWGLGVVPPHPATIQISVQKMEFSPTEVSANVGDAIEWNNEDVLLHSATARNGDFDVNLPPKKTGSVVLKKAGTVDYYCRYHPNMKATINVAP